MKRTLFAALSAAVITTSLGSFSAQASAIEPNGTKTVEASVESTYVEIPNVRVIEEPIIMPMGLLLDQTVIFNGQGGAEFTYKAPASGTDKVRAYAKNSGKKTVNYKLTSPTGTDWYSGTISPGNYILTEHIFRAEQAGRWVMSFSTPDGSAGTVDVSFRDGL
ncbi:hypothetical protein ACQKFM_22480 [Paenibacillus xylanexedens]|uniref:hypothetical protein n=1 Tax=Paenibacillus xylanexedens TaxID=528191 RepID=UPI003D061AC1